MAALDIHELVLEILSYIDNIEDSETKDHFECDPTGELFEGLEAILESHLENYREKIYDEGYDSGHDSGYEEGLDACECGREE